MSNRGFVVGKPAPVLLPVVGCEEAFAVGTVYCIGQNYAEHAREMGHDPTREAPFFFSKATSCVTTQGSVPYPRKSRDVHFEVELVAALGRGGRQISEAEALYHVFGYAVGLDMTRRDLQAEVKAAGRPWDVAKSFPSAAPCSAILPVSELQNGQERLLSEGTISLFQNGVQQQAGRLDQMIWSLPEQIAILSDYFDLKPGDLVFTGTPAGVGPVAVGDKLVGVIEGVGRLGVEIISAIGKQA